MVITIAFVFLLLAFVCFVVAAINAPVPKINIMALGLAFFTVAQLVGR